MKAPQRREDEKGKAQTVAMRLEGKVAIVTGTSPNIGVDGGATAKYWTWVPNVPQAADGEAG
jgi:hypothetical protein